MPDRVPNYRRGPSRKANARAYGQSDARREDIRFYQSEAWRSLRADYLRERPLCEDCQAEGRDRPANHVHHIRERKERPDLALEWTNLQALCLPCHNAKRGKAIARVQDVIKRLVPLLLVLALWGCSEHVTTPPPPPPPPPSGGVALELLEAHNRERAKRRLIPYRLAIPLQQAAWNHAKHMANVGKLGHFGIGDGDPWMRIKAVGYEYAMAGENAAAGQRDVEQVMGDWMSSPGHRSNILGRYVDFGGAMARGRDGTAYWCTVFATPGRAAAPPPASASAPPTPEATATGQLVPPATHEGAREQ